MKFEDLITIDANSTLARVIEKYPEFLDFLQVLDFGAKKHGDENWLAKNGTKSSHKDMCSSMFRHLAQVSCGGREDEESGLNPLLHLIVRACMCYTRQRRNIKHSEDLK